MRSFISSLLFLSLCAAVTLPSSDALAYDTVRKPVQIKTVGLIDFKRSDDGATDDLSLKANGRWYLLDGSSTMIQLAQSLAGTGKLVAVTGTLVRTDAGVALKVDQIGEPGTVGGSDLEKFQGTWTAHSLATGSPPTDTTMIVEGTAVTWSTADVTVKGQLQLDETSNPKGIQFLKLDVKAKDLSTTVPAVRGLYRFAGDKIELCIGTDINTAPASFSDCEKGKGSLTTLTR
jgi:uncharacterized protein (TIGR03067 family)